MSASLTSYILTSGKMQGRKVIDQGRRRNCKLADPGCLGVDLDTTGGNGKVSAGNHHSLKAVGDTYNSGAYRLRSTKGNALACFHSRL